jgi:glycosyltransferase involved in cell wall biosynthesis
MKPPLISVVIPTYNRETYLLESLESALAQTHAPLQIIVVDDGSTDHTVDLLAPYQQHIHYVYQGNHGIGAARNVGARLCQGEFLSFLDSDDIWLPDKLERQLGYLLTDPDLDAVYGHAEQFICPRLDAASAARLRHMDGKIMAAPISCSLLIRRQSFWRVGGFDENQPLCTEIDWYARFQDQGLKSMLLDKVLYRRRLHSSNANLTLAQEQPMRLRALKAIIDRRRAGDSRRGVE